MGIALIPVTGVSLPGRVARYLLQRHSAALPDLSELVVLVPNRRAGLDLARELALAAGLPAFIPPVITPLKAWAENHADAAEPQARRLARLAGVLRREKWLGKVDKWALASELLALADELSAARLGREIAARIRALQGRVLDRETALVEAVWRALNNDGSDPQAVYAHALERLLEQAPRPLYGYALGPLTALEKQFLERYAERAPVRLFDTAAELIVDSPLAATLHSAWCCSEPPVRDRAAELALAHPASPALSRLKLCPVPHLEAEARSVAAWVAEQLQAGRRDIAMIALDREAARRTRALLERLDVLVTDETGWTLSTTAAAAVIDRWLECVVGDFPHVELLDLLKSPFVLGDPALRQDAVLAFELALRRQNVARGMGDMRPLAQNLATPCPWLDTLFDAARNFSQSRATLAGWLTRLTDSLAAIEALAPLARDAAGADLLALIERLARELADDGEKYSFGEWRRWLNLALESESFTDKSIASSIVFTSLPAARGRAFDAVAVIGADAARLPARPAPGLFSQATRAQLGLATAGESAAQAADDLIQLLVQGPSLLSWQAWAEDEPNPPSPFVTLLQTLHQAGWGCELPTQGSAVPPAQKSELPAPSRQPAPAVAVASLPRRYSPTAYQTLLDCPYRFFARNVLGLKELDEADEALDKSDYGNALHAILQRFHDSKPPAEREAALKLLDEFSEAEFAGLPAYTAAAWRARWKKIQPGYIGLWLAHTAEGWRYQSGEEPFKVVRSVPGLGEVELCGRVDRIDSRINQDGGKAVRVIDYKTASAASLKKKLKDPAEAVQLPFYAWLAEAEAAFLPINDDPVAPLTLDGETDVEAIALRLPKLLEAMAKGSPLPANGIDAVCSHCEARGLCRKGTWHE